MDLTTMLDTQKASYGNPIFVTAAGNSNESTANTTPAFEPQFSGAFGDMKFLEEDLFVDPAEQKAMISWTCSIETSQGTASWRGLDLLHFDGRRRITRKATYAKAKTLKLDPSDQE